MTEQESTSKQLHSRCLLRVTFEPPDCVCVRETCVFCVPVCAVSTQSLQPAAPCGTHLTGEQRRLSAERGGKLRAALALENRQEGRRAAATDVGSRQKGRAAEQAEGKEDRREDILSPGKRQTGRQTPPLFCSYIMFLSATCFLPPRAFSFSFYCFELVKFVAPSQ